MKFKNFNIPIVVLSFVFLFTFINSCKPKSSKKEMKMSNNSSRYEFSLAQWSLHKGIFNGSIDPMNFASDAKKMGFSGLEYVSQLYVSKDISYPYKKKGLPSILKELKSRSEKFGMKNLIIMIDGEGDLSFSDEALTNKAIENHKKWIDAASYLGCHSIRINLFGETDHQLWVKNSVRSLKALVAYAQPKGISILVENHGGNSSNASLLTKVMNEVNSKYCGTLPDFGNFCLERKGGERWGTPCIKEYDKYKGIKELMPFAKGVSAKSYEFNEIGEETKIDYKMMMKIVDDSSFKGFIGIEYEGDKPTSGIKATKALLEKIINKKTIKK